MTEQVIDKKPDPDPSEERLAARIRKLDLRLKAWEEKVRRLLSELP